jgi:hypothetical protein
MRTARILAICCLLALPLAAQTTTPNIHLEIPATGGQNWQTQVNFNWNLLDTLLSDVPHAGGYVSSIDSQTGAFTFTGSGVAHTGNAYTFSSTGGSMTWPAAAGVANYAGSNAWGTSYSATNLIPANFISTLNQNTSGTAGNLSGTPALPNGTTASTQATTDTSTKVANMAAVQAVITSQGVGGRTVPGTTDTIASTDRGQSVLYTSTSSTAVTLPDPSTLGTNFVFVASARTGAGIVIFTASAGTFLNSSGGSSTTQNLRAGQTCSFSSPDSTNYLARCAAAPSLSTYTVSALPSASIWGAGAIVEVTDAASFTTGTCTGGGSNTMIAVSSGSAWSCH